MHVNNPVEFNGAIEMRTVTYLRSVCKPKLFVVILGKFFNLAGWFSASQSLETAWDTKILRDKKNQKSDSQNIQRSPEVFSPKVGISAPILSREKIKHLGENSAVRTHLGWQVLKDIAREVWAPTSNQIGNSYSLKRDCSSTCPSEVFFQFFHCQKAREKRLTVKHQDPAI